MLIITGNAIWSLIRQSDAVSISVLLILLVMSIICWSIALYKLLTLRLKIKEAEGALQHLHAVATFDQLITRATILHGTLPGALLARALTTAHVLKVKYTASPCPLTAEDAEVLRADIESALYEVMIEQESYTPFLKTCAEAAPLLGLFGTIWGLIHSFVRISQEQNADIVTVAPGIAEALITTLGGLVVAIPALFLFYVVYSRTRTLEHYLVLVATKTERIVQTLLAL